MGANGKERSGGEGVRLLFWRGTPEVFAVVAWCPERGLVGVGGVVARLGPGVCDARVLEGFGWPELARRTCRSVQSPQRAGVRQWWWWSNRQGSRASCASRVLGLSRPRVRERERQGESMESDSGPCPDRFGRYGLGVAGRCGCEGVETGSPGDSARCRGVTARARLVGGAERRGGARGARPRSLSRAGALERASVTTHLLLKAELLCICASPWISR
jgi:hypothetical protein